MNSSEVGDSEDVILAYFYLILLIHSDVMEVEDNPPSEFITLDRHNLTVYPWHINTKYYDADIHFVELKERDIVSEHFCNSIEAVVIFFNNHDVSF